MQPGLRILVITRDGDFISRVSATLKERFHHEIVAANGAREATKKLEGMSAGVDMILADYEMRDMDGLEFMGWMKGNKIQTPVIMLTAGGADLEAAEAMKAGAYDYVRKDQLDLDHLGYVINATHERHLFRINQEFEEERLQEMGLNSQATDKARDVLNTITPPLNTALANINYEIEVKSEESLKGLSDSARTQVKNVLDEVMKEVRVLEMSVRGLLTLYRILYAHHKEGDEIEEIRRDVEKSLKAK